MPTYKIRGVDVDFPFEAYECQLVYMEKVIQSLQNRCNALLESPTGTGKTLCLLCATLAWRRSLGDFSTGGSKNICQISSSNSMVLSQSETNNLPTIVYTSRTHSQLRQVIQELKRTSYRPKMVVLGSREQLCIHEEVSLLRGKAQTNACHYLCKKRQKRHCAHFPLAADYMKHNPHLGDEPVDIEDLVNIGRRFGPCPYYVSRELHKVVDILFAPYNYLIDRGYRKHLSLEWNNSVLIFDEAHNLESICADAASFDLPAGLLTACISEAKNCVDLAIARRDISNDKSLNPDNFAILRALLLKLEKKIAELPIESKELGFTKPGHYIYELLGELNITHETAPKLIDIIEEAMELLEEDKMQNTKGTTCRLETIGDILKIIFTDKGNGHAEFYRVHVQEAEANAADVLRGRTSRTLSWWCFNPGVAMHEFSKMNVGSVILTSGTLSPLDSFAQELKLDFPVRLENPHVISSNQIWAGVVPVGPSGHSFNSSYRYRDSLEYKQELGNAIVNFARIVPDGLLVFFPSYYLLDQCIGCWKNMGHGNSSTIWERICKHKKPVIEPRQSSLFASSIEDYMAKLKDASSSGAVFFAVCRGKVSEGLDFADHAARAVVITGMPFATRSDPKVKKSNFGLKNWMASKSALPYSTSMVQLKRDYLDQHAQVQREKCKTTASLVLTGDEWYNQQASRAVNQAVGRVIRHHHDYGAIIFCDERFMQSSRQSQISHWIQPYIKCYSKYGDVVSTLTRFFRDGAIRTPTKLLKQTESVDLSSTKKLLQNERIKEAAVENMPLSMGSPYLAHGSGAEMKTVQLVNKFHLEKLLNPVNTTVIDKACSNGSLSSLVEVKRGSISSQLKDFLPANCSSLTPYARKQALKLKCSSDLISNEKKLLISGRKNLKYQNHEMIDLTGDSLLDKKSSKEELLASCLMKRRKLSGPELDAVQHAKDTREHESSSNKLQSEEREQRLGAEFLSHENKDIQAMPVPCRENEARASVFLVQVQEKLSAAEYKEFVGHMKAIKSKAVNVGHVLQSMVQLFSEPERLHLLRSFKDYVPAKHHSLYEQYVEHIMKQLRSRAANCGSTS